MARSSEGLVFLAQCRRGTGRCSVAWLPAWCLPRALPSRKPWLWSLSFRREVAFLLYITSHCGVLAVPCGRTCTPDHHKPLMLYQWGSRPFASTCDHSDEKRSAHSVQRVASCRVAHSCAKGHGSGVAEQRRPTAVLLERPVSFRFRPPSTP